MLLSATSGRSSSSSLAQTNGVLLLVLARLAVLLPRLFFCLVPRHCTRRRPQGGPQTASSRGQWQHLGRRKRPCRERHVGQWRAVEVPLPQHTPTDPAPAAGAAASPTPAIASKATAQPSCSKQRRHLLLPQPADSCHCCHARAAAVGRHRRRCRRPVAGAQDAAAPLRGQLRCCCCCCCCLAAEPAAACDVAAGRGAHVVLLLLLLLVLLVLLQVVGLLLLVVHAESTVEAVSTGSKGV